MKSINGDLKRPILKYIEEKEEVIISVDQVRCSDRNVLKRGTSNRAGDISRRQRAADRFDGCERRQSAMDKRLRQGGSHHAIRRVKMSVAIV